MKTELFLPLASTLGAHAQQPEGDVEYSLARDMQHLPGYTEWRDFNRTAVAKDKIACEVPGHLVYVNKMGGSSQRDRLINAKRHDSKHGSALTRITIDAPARKGYGNRRIRPLAVRPLDHPERWPIPWGFLFLARERQQWSFRRGDRHE